MYKTTLIRHLLPRPTENYPPVLPTGRLHRMPANRAVSAGGPITGNTYNCSVLPREKHQATLL